MSGSGAGSIVRNGLIYCIDTFDRTSFSITPDTSAHIHDLSGNHYDSSVWGNAQYSSAFKALWFNNAGARVYIPITTLTTSLTWNAWVYATNTISNNNFMGRAASPAFMFLDSYNPIFACHLGGVLKTCSGSTLGGQRPNMWRFFSVTLAYDTVNTSIKIYDNARLVYTGSGAGAISTTNEAGYPGYPFVLGDDGFSTGGTERLYDGYISSVSMYNRALTADEITQNFLAHKARYYTTS